MNFMYNWFSNNLNLITFIYGLAFIVIGVSILVSQKNNSRFKISGILWFFAAYAFIHATADFIKMWSDIKYRSDGLFMTGKALELVSYIFVFEFGRRIINILKPEIKILSPLLLPFIITTVFTASMMTENYMVTFDVLMGYFVRFPGGFMAGLGLRYYYMSEKNILPASVKKYFFLGGAALLVWSFLCGVIRVKGDFFPANVLNIDSFFMFFKTPVYLFRSACAIIISWSFVGILGIFNWERQKMIEDLLETERDSKEQLKSAKNGLEIMVRERTADLEKTCMTLKEEIDLRIKAEQGEKDAYKFQQAIIDNLADSVVVIDKDCSVKLMNRASKKLYDETDITEFSCSKKFCTKNDLEKIRETMTYEYEMNNMSGEKIYAEMIISPLIMEDGTSRGIIETTRDITERRRLEKEIITIIESERQRIGQDLHDDLAQNLMAIDILCKMLNEKLIKKRDTETEAGELGKIITFVNNSITTTRRIAKGLCPIQMENGGFSEAVKKMVNNLKDIFGMTINLKIDENIAINDNITAINLYQIIREAINNIVKHSMAKNVSIEINGNNKNLAIAINDDGIGIPDDLENRAGLGIRIMKYRANMIGSKLEIGRNNGHGTEIRCSLPVHAITLNPVTREYYVE